MNQLEQEVAQLRQTVQTLRQELQTLQRVVQNQVHTKQMNIFDLVIENSLRFGNGAGRTIRMDREGLWIGADTLAEITTSLPPIPATAILSDGTIYAKDGDSGTFTEYGGGQLTFVNGICTNIA